MNLAGITVYAEDGVIVLNVGGEQKTSTKSIDQLVDAIAHYQTTERILAALGLG